MPDEEDDEGPREVERGSMEHSVEQYKESRADDGDEDGIIEFIGGIRMDVSDAGNYVVVDPEDDYEDDYEDDDDDDHSDEDGFDPDEENWEAEDMDGDSADEREEAYDNHDWDAADG